MNMNPLRSPLVLPEDLLLIPVTDLPAAVRERLGDGGEEFALTRLHAREPSKLIDAAAAGLIENFREPRTVVQAVIAYSRDARLDPEHTLEQALPLLRQLIATGLLVPESSDGAKRIDATLAPGAGVGGYRVMRVIQLLDDSELYQARAANGACAALKLARRGHETTMRPRLVREAKALRRLAGAAAPELLAEGEHDGRPILAIAWVAGVDGMTAAEELRQAGNRAGMLTLRRRVAEAYAAIHGLGVLHGDVHPRNLLVGRAGEVTLLDFGFAQIAGMGFDPRERGGVGFFIEPESATRLLEDQPPLPATERSEQFAVAALLYLLAARHHYVDFTLQHDEMLRQIRDATPLPFAERNAEPWPGLEAALSRALAKVPGSRYPDMATFSAALAAVEVAGRAPAIVHGDDRNALVASMVEFVDLDGPLFRDGLPHGPLSSVNFGAAGIAYALYRLACARDEPRLLAMADAWLDKAAADAQRDDAFVNREMDLTPETVGRVSPYHTATGIHLVRALIDSASGNRPGCHAAVAAYAEAVDQPCSERDLALGRCGTLQAAALLVESIPDLGPRLREVLVATSSARLRQLWSEVEDFDDVQEGRDWANMGVAHGWAGLLYVSLRWHTATGAPLPSGVAARLDQVFRCARPTGRGLGWPWRHGPANQTPDASMPGWCNGSAGILPLACLAYRVLGDVRCLEHAEGAAWHCWEAGDGPADLCCGYAGRAYALLDLHHTTGDPRWLARAGALADRAVRVAPNLRTPQHPRHSLYKGELGLVVLLCELNRPGAASMPLFGEEGRG